MPVHVCLASIYTVSTWIMDQTSFSCVFMFTLRVYVCSSDVEHLKQLVFSIARLQATKARLGMLGIFWVMSL